jgi:YD repeat-containing protein
MKISSLSKAWIITLVIQFSLLCSPFLLQTDAQTVLYSYDDLNRLTQVDFGNGKIIEYTYDKRGNCVIRKVVSDALNPPTIENIAFDRCISELCQCTVAVHAADPEGGDLDFTWEPLDGGTILGSGPSILFESPQEELNNGCHSYRIKVTVLSAASRLSTDETIEVYVKTPGDVNGDGAVNVLDKVRVRNAFGQSGEPGWTDADVNCDGAVNILDKVQVRNQFGQTGCACPE